MTRLDADPFGVGVAIVNVERMTLQRGTHTYCDEDEQCFLRCEPSWQPAPTLGKLNNAARLASRFEQSPADLQTVPTSSLSSVKIATPTPPLF